MASSEDELNEADQCQIFSSVPYQFVVDGKSFYVHEELVSQMSKPLGRMLQSSMRKRKQGYAKLEEVDQGTFVRFLEWLYRGFYHAPQPIKMPNFVFDEPILADVQNDSFDVDELLAEDNMEAPPPSAPPEPKLKAKKKKKKENIVSGEGASDYKHENHGGTSTVAKEIFIKRKYAIRKTVKSLPQPRNNVEVDDDYTNVFLSHAYLYVFADKYDVQPLKRLALEELHATLSVITLYPERTGDILTLLRYVYKEAPEQTNKKEDLRTLMRQYVALEIETLIKNKDLGNFLMEDANLMDDFLKILRQRNKLGCTCHSPSEGEPTPAPQFSGLVGWNTRNTGGF